MENKQIIVMAKLVAKPGKENEVKYAIKALIGPTRKEAGCVSYNFYQGAVNRAIFLSHEIWASHEMFTKHLETPYIRALQEAGEDLLVGGLEVTFVESIG